MRYSNTALYMLFDPTTGEPFYVGQSVSPSERIVQHLEEANDRDRFAHPKKLHITELLAAGAVPEMWVFDRLPGIAGHRKRPRRRDGADLDRLLCPPARPDRQCR